MRKVRLKILHVVFSLEPGGMENGLVNVASGLNKEEFEVHVCCLDRGGAFIDRLPQPEHVYILHRTKGFSLGTILALRKLIGRVNPDVIHTHNFGPLAYSALATWFGSTKPILHGEHGVLPEDQCTAEKVRKRRWLYRACRKVHTVSMGQTDQLAKLGLPLNHLVTVINGVDTDRFVPGAKEEARKHIGHIPVDATVIGIVGRFVALKRHVELFDAFEQIGAEFPRVHLLVVGAGGSEESRIIQRAKDHRVADRIHLVGFQADPRPFYRAMDLLVVPSVVEGMSNVVLEAMACGIPVLAHNACGNAEMLTQREDGVVEDLSSVEKLRDALKRTLQNREQLGTMGEQARRNVVQKFSIKRMVENYESLYCDVAGVPSQGQEQNR